MLDAELDDALEQAYRRNPQQLKASKRRPKRKPPMPYDLRDELDKPTRDYLDHIDGH